MGDVYVMRDSHVESSVEAVDISKEAYFAILLDRESGCPVLMASSEGGMDIEEVAARTPDKIVKLVVPDLAGGPSQSQALDVAAKMGFEGAAREEAAEQVQNLYRLFVNVDATQIEINPFCQTADGRIMCLDAKLTFDDNAAFRQKSIFEQQDTAEEDANELEAQVSPHRLTAHETAHR